MQGQRIDQRVHDQVILSMSSCGGSSGRRRVDRDPRVAVRLVGMMAPSQLVEHRVDLDGVDVARHHGQRRGDVVSRAGPDDQHVFERFRPASRLSKCGR